VSEGRAKLIPLAGTVLLHVAVVAWLAATPEQRAAVMRAVEMDVVDLTPEPEELQPEQREADQEPPPPPPPEPEQPLQRPVPRAKLPPPPEAPPPQPQEESPPDEPPSQEPSAPPAMLDFGEQNLAAPGSGTGWNMATSEGSASQGLYRRGNPNATSGGSGGGGSPPAAPAPPPRPDFAPVPSSQLSREPSLVGRISTDYPPEARRQSIEGAVRLLVEIRANGQVRNVRILSEPGGGLGNAAAEQLRRARFNPARDRNGRPVDTRIIYTVRYLLDE
jgi:protein TonB